VDLAGLLDTIAEEDAEDAPFVPPVPGQRPPAPATIAPPPTPDPPTVDEPAAASNDIGNLLDEIAGTDPTPPSTPTRLPANEEQAIARALRNCWNVDRGAPFIETLRVTILARMGSDGYVQQAEIVEFSGQAGDSQLRSWAEAARRAVLNTNCQPLPAPSRGFGNGEEYQFNFNPRDMF
jgi:hypothetical protein